MGQNDSDRTTKPHDSPSAPVSRAGAVNSALYLGIAQLVRLILTTLSTIVIARSVTPDDYGLMAMAALAIALAAMFQDVGLRTIHKPVVTQAESSALFWINVLASAAIALVLLAASALVGWFYHDVRAGAVVASSGLAMIVSGLSLQHSALLNREMRFDLVSLIDVANAVCMFLVAAIAAFLLHSYWALFLGTLAGAVVPSILMWRFFGFRPSWRHGRAAALITPRWWECRDAAAAAAGRGARPGELLAALHVKRPAILLSHFSAWQPA